MAVALLAVALSCAQGAPGPSPGPSDQELESQGGPAPAGRSAPVVCTGADGGYAWSKYKWPLYGDLHLHTGHSLDAWSFGTRALPADAYLFAKKLEKIQLATGSSKTPAGPTVEIDRPLDFLAVTDHSEWMGVAGGCTDPSSSYYSSPDCVRVRSAAPVDEGWTFQHMGSMRKEFCDADAGTAAECAAEERSVWGDEQLAAANAYQPCLFSSFIAHEWTNSTGHRNVIFGSDVVPAAPLDSITYPTSKALWDALDAQCPADGGCSAITPPHNTNIYGGYQFALPASPADVPQMRKYQKAVEIYQHKGASECFWQADGGDPYCAFERVTTYTLADGGTSDVPQAYARTALESGLGYALENGTANPLMMGFIGATDDHNGTPANVVESAYVGHAGRGDDDPVSRLSSIDSVEKGSGAVTVAWAEQNTRDSIFAALQRRETYATSGPRITLRFYQTTSSTPCTSFPNAIIDAKAAIPMGGLFGPAQLVAGKANFVIGAWPDPQAQVIADAAETVRVAGLQHLQVIKAHGKLSGGVAKIVEDPLVELSIPAAGGCVTWTDPAFDATERAFYYVRVLQEKTWRWSHFDCKGSSAPLCATWDKGELERAWSSPIWYTP